MSETQAYSIEIELVDTDAKEPISKEDPSTCKITGRSIVNPPATLDELQERINKAVNTSSAAQNRRIINNTDPNLN